MKSGLKVVSQTVAGLLRCSCVIAVIAFGVFLIQTMETKINSDYEKK